MELTTSQLTTMLSEAFDFGYSGTAEQRDEVISDILDKYKIVDNGEEAPPEPDVDKDFRLYNVDALLQLPVGTTFHHSILGRCVIQQRGNDKYMLFDNPSLEPSAFNVDGYPWTTAMKRLS